MNPRTRLHRSQDTPQGLHQTQGSSWRPKSAILNSKLVGGPGFEPGASRSRTVRPEVRLQRWIQRPEALVAVGVGRLPFALWFDHVAHADARLHSLVRVGDYAARDASQQRRAEG